MLKVKQELMQVKVHRGQQVHREQQVLKVLVDQQETQVHKVLQEHKVLQVQEQQVLKVQQVQVIQDQQVLRVLLDRQESHQVLYYYGQVLQITFHLVGYYVMVLIAHQI